jgi:uncharacterized protein YecE (DUF72 family)
MIQETSSLYMGLYIGTAGWAYPHWNGVVYPKKPAPGSHSLELVSKHLDLVEINSSFYQYLKPEVAKLWIKKVSERQKFLFTAKLHQRFTHMRMLEDSEIQAFKEGLWPLLKAGRLGALLMQFPWSFRFTAENQDFLIRLRRAFHEFPLAAEMRHSSWMAEEAVGTFLDYRIGFCNIDQPEYTRAMPPTSLLTSGVGYVRLHGRNPANALGAPTHDKIPADKAAAARMRQHDYLYNAAELEDWTRRIAHLQRFADQVFVVFNNDAAGKSFVNALELRSAMTGVRGSAPRDLRRKYPVQLAPFDPAYAEQQLLFSAA